MLVLLLSTQTVPRSPAASGAPLTRLSIPKDIDLILGNGRCPHNPQLISGHNLEKRHFLEKRRETVALSCLWAEMGKVKNELYTKVREGNWAVAVEIRFLASSSMFVPCSLHRPSPQPSGWAPCRGQSRSLGVAGGPRATAVTPQRAELARGQGMKVVGRGLALSYSVSSSWGLGRKAQCLGDSQYKHTAILYNSACNTCCESPSLAARGLKHPGAAGRVQPFSVAPSYRWALRYTKLKTILVGLKLLL